MSVSSTQCVWAHLPRSDPSPSRRHGHAVSAFEGKMYSFAGSYHGKVDSEMWCFDLQQRTWELLDCVGDFPSPRSDHTMVVHEASASFFVLYGRGVDLKYQGDPIYRYWIREKRWERIFATGRPPKFRSCADAVLVDRDPNLGCSAIYLFGGWNMRRYFPHLFVLRLDTFVWTKLRIKPGEGISQRLGHSMALNADQSAIYVWAGEEFNGRYLRDMWKFTIISAQWEKIDQGPEDFIPSKRNSHKMCQVDQYLYIHGGYDGKVFFSDIHRFDMTRNCWEHVPAICYGLQPPALTCHSMVMFRTPTTEVKRVAQEVLDDSALYFDIPQESESEPQSIAGSTAKSGPPMLNRYARPQYINVPEDFAWWNACRVADYACPCDGTEHPKLTSSVSACIMGGWQYDSRGWDIRSREVFYVHFTAPSSDGATEGPSTSDA